MCSGSTWRSQSSAFLSCLPPSASEGLSEPGKASRSTSRLVKTLHPATTAARKDAALWLQYFRPCKAGWTHHDSPNMTILECTLIVIITQVAPA